MTAIPSISRRIVAVTHACGHPHAYNLAGFDEATVTVFLQASAICKCPACREVERLDKVKSKTSEAP